MGQVRCRTSTGTFAGEAWRQQRCRSGWDSSSRVLINWLVIVGVIVGLGGLGVRIADFGLLFGVLSTEWVALHCSAYSLASILHMVFLRNPNQQLHANHKAQALYLYVYVGSRFNGFRDVWRQAFCKYLAVLVAGMEPQGTGFRVYSVSRDYRVYRVYRVYVYRVYRCNLNQ